jgi:hypothetical protein
MGPTQVKLCPHRMNPISCPTCYRLKPKDEVKKAQPNSLPGIPQGHVIPIGEATQRATMNAARARIAAPKAHAATNNAKAPAEPFYSGNHSPPPEAHDPDKVWQPPERASLIDSVPVHPHLAETKMQIRG